MEAEGEGSLGQKILEYLASHEGVSTLDISAALNQEHQRIVGSIKSLESIGGLILASPRKKAFIELTAEGEFP